MPVFNLLRKWKSYILVNSIKCTHRYTKMLFFWIKDFIYVFLVIKFEIYFLMGLKTGLEVLGHNFHKTF